MKRACSALCVLLTMAGLSFAQETTGSIVGTVLDASGSGAPGAKVTEASAIQVESQISTAQNLIEGNQIRELSLNARNYEQLVALMPGVTNTSTGDQIYVGVSNPLSGQSNAVTFSINCGRTDQNNWTVDGADKNFRLTERGANLQFRAESFNTFNHTNWASIGATLGSSTFGQVTAARDARIVSFALKLYY